MYFPLWKTKAIYFYRGALCQYVSPFPPPFIILGLFVFSVFGMALLAFSDYLGQLMGDEDGGPSVGDHWKGLIVAVRFQQQKYLYRSINSNFFFKTDIRVVGHEYRDQCDAGSCESIGV